MMILNKLGLSFELNSNNFTARVIGSLNLNENILIPRCIDYQNKDYVITSIAKYSFKGQKQIKSIRFSDDSCLLLIEKKAFFRSSINHLSLPASIENLEEGWCHSTPKLISISVSPQNSRFSFIDNKFLVGKSNFDSKKFDILHFVRRDIKGEVIIPSSIKEIHKYSFCDCKLLKSIEFEEESEIQRIHKSSFFNSSIEKVQIPTMMKEIEGGWCKKANKMKSISSNNRNFLYEKNLLLGKSNHENDQFDLLLFASRDLKKALIPSYIKRICQYAFAECKNLKSIVFESSSEIESICQKSFAYTSIQEVKFPSSLCCIEKSSFDHCKQLKHVIFPSDSKLTSIDEDAFNSSGIEEISFPSNLVEIKRNAFNSCTHLKSIKFDNESKLEKIGDESFLLTACSKICFPSSVVEIGEKSFSNCYDLVSIEFPVDSKLKVIKKNAFSKSSLKSVVIPSSVKELGEESFSECWPLESVRFEKESEIEVIEKNLFFDSKIQSFSIPSKVKELKEGWCCDVPELNSISVSPQNEHFKYLDDKFLFGKSDEKSDIFDVLLFVRRDIEHVIIPSITTQIGPFAFSNCKNLKSVKFEKDSRLVSIGNYAFTSSTLESIFIPSSVCKIGELAFGCCHSLQQIDNFENLQIRSIENQIFEWSALKTISIPSKVVELKEKWCCGTSELIHCSVSPNNQHFSVFCGNLLLGKGNEKSDIFDVIHFCNRNVKQVTIPSIIKRIESFAFSACVHLNSVEFEQESQLESIEKQAFCATRINQILIPSNVKKIGEYAFGQCKCLRSVNFEENSKLCTIEKAAFQESSIAYITIPKNVNIIREHAFQNCTNISSIEILGNEITFENDFLDSNASSIIISFPNALKVNYFMKMMNNSKGAILIYIPVGTDIYL